MQELSISERMKPIDGLRGIGAIVIALFFHYRGHMVETMLHPLYKWFPFITEWGWIFVEMFFIISGMSFAYFYWERIRDGKITAKSFFVSRFSRLYPVFLFTLVVVAFFQMIRAFVGLDQFIYMNNNFYNFIISAFFLQGCGLTLGDCFNGVAWAACVEGLLYIVFFLVSRRAKDKWTLSTCSVVGIIIGYAIELLWDKHVPLITFNVGRGFVAFWFGVLLAQIMIILWKSKEKRLISCYAFLFVLIIYIIEKKYGMQVFGPDLHCVEIFTFVAFPCVIYLVTSNTFLRKVFGSKGFNYFGKISYCIYMVHFPIQLIYVTINDVFKQGWDYTKISFWLVYSITTILSSVLLYELYEKRMKNKITSFMLKK